jgi:purine-nucleoside phosphorylase
MTTNLRKKYSKLIKEIKTLAPFEADLALVLGSGLGEFADTVKKIKSVETSALPDYPQSTVEGHKGFIHFCEYEGKRFIVFQGRIHLYEGYTLEQSLLPVLIANALGADKILLTNAAGGVGDNLRPGDLMTITSFNMLNIKKELAETLGLATFDERRKVLHDFPSRELTEKLTEAALIEKIHLKEGVYWFNKGPSYETRAEIQMVKKFGVAAVGMSTAHEAVFAAKIGMSVAAFSLITNFAAGISPVKLSHREVIETAEAVKPKLERLIKRFVVLN